jgi:hypothetical protein
MCPPAVKIPLRGIVGSAPEPRQDQERRAWRLVSHFYLAPFLRIASSVQLGREAKERILQFVDEVVKHWGFTGELTHLSLEGSSPMPAGLSRIERITRLLLKVDEGRCRQLIEGSVASGEIQIRIMGGCLNLVQLYQLLILIHSHREEFAKVSERVVLRTLKIFEISPNLQVLHRERAGALFASLFELRYEESIDSDYYRNYTVVYRGSTLRQMLKQVLVEIGSLGRLHATHHNSLTRIFEGIARQEDSKRASGFGMPAQLLMKVKYLIYLLAKQPAGEALILEEMLADLTQRNNINFKLFEETKFSLLKVYCNLRNLQNQLRHQREVERRVASRIALIQKVEETRLDLCVTSKASRNLNEQETADKYRYRLSAADDILVLPTSECIQVKHYLKHPSFLEASSESPFSYCSEAKIGEALSTALSMLAERLSLLPEERAVVEEVIFRCLSEELLGIPSHPLCGYLDRALSEVEEVRDCESPSKRTGESRKRRGSFDPRDFGLSSGMHEEQLYGMGRRCKLLPMQTSLHC